MAPLGDFWADLATRWRITNPAPPIAAPRYPDAFRALDRDPAPDDKSGFSAPGQAVYPYARDLPNNRRFQDLGPQPPPLDDQVIYSPRTKLGQGLWSQNSPVIGRVGDFNPYALPWTAVQDENGTPVYAFSTRRLVVGEVMGGVGGDNDSIVSTGVRSIGAPFAPPVPREKPAGLALRGQAAFDYLEQDPSPIADLLASIYTVDSWPASPSGIVISKVQSAAVGGGGGGAPPGGGGGGAGGRAGAKIQP